MSSKVTVRTSTVYVVELSEETASVLEAVLRKLNFSDPDGNEIAELEMLKDLYNELPGGYRDFEWNEDDGLLELVKE